MPQEPVGAIQTRLQSPQYVAWMLASSDDITRTLEPGSIVFGGNRKGPKSLSILIIVSGLKQLLYAKVCHVVSELGLVELFLGFFQLPQTLQGIGIEVFESC